MDSFFEFYETLPPDFWWIESRNDLIDKLFPKFVSNKDLRILDIGCGIGLNYKSLKALSKLENSLIFKGVKFSAGIGIVCIVKK